MRVWMLAGGLFAELAGCGFAPQLSPDAPADSVGDRDHDGILDDVDNCPSVSNPDQRDYDHDGRGDVCDLCPHLASASDADSDNDGIGDDCDPQPQNGADKLALWNGFYEAGSITGWVPGPGTWTWADGTVHQDNPAPGDRFLTAPSSYKRISVATSFQVNAISAGGAIGFCSGVLPATQQYCCTVQANGPTVVAISLTGTGESRSAPWPSTLSVGDRIRLVQNPATSNRCDAFEGTTSAGVSAKLGPTMGNFELYTAGAAAAFDYVFIVELGS